MEHPTTHDAFPIFKQGDPVSSATAYPGSVQDVHFIMRWANKHEFPVFPISIGRNIGYSGAGPRVRGSLTIDMGRRMNKVIKLDERSCSCIVEPGVTYFARYEAIQKAGANVMMDTPDLGGGSLIGNICERGIGFVYCLLPFLLQRCFLRSDTHTTSGSRYTPLGDHCANHFGMEVVLPTGEVVRLGMGSLPGRGGAENPTWASYQYASLPQHVVPVTHMALESTGESIVSPYEHSPNY